MANKNSVVFDAGVSIRMARASVACQMCSLSKEIVDKAVCRSDCIDAIGEAYDIFYWDDQSGDEMAVSACGYFMLTIVDTCRECPMDDEPRVKKFIEKNIKKIESEKKSDESGGRKVLQIDSKKS